jgi:hypothetical protein
MLSLGLFGASVTFSSMFSSLGLFGTSVAVSSEADGSSLEAVVTSSSSCADVDDDEEDPSLAVGVVVSMTEMMVVEDPI